MGVEEKELDKCLAIIGEASKTRKQFVNVLPPDAGPVGTFIPSPVEVEVGGAIAFVLPVESFVKF
jgi:uncharacterized protein YaaQ